MKKIVYLVDNKKRDLPGAILLMYHLEKLGIECIIEPLEAWKAALYAHKPNMILFNHLLGSHLVEYSLYLKKIGVLVGVLPNEGILYNQEVLDFNSSKFHNGAHIDYFFVWNESHKKAILKDQKNVQMNVEIIGVPRFDFYFSPFLEKKENKNITLLVCTNFVFSQFIKKDPSIANKLFAPWKGRIDSYSDYWELIRTNAKSKEMFFNFLNKIVNLNKFNIILKPHPGEDPSDYDLWYRNLDDEKKSKIIYDKKSYIWELIPKCDLEIACETCTTSLESWIAGKKTIELELTKNKVFYHEFISKMSTVCNAPEYIIDKIYDTLNNEPTEEQLKLRKEHLEKWCDTPKGNSTYKLAIIIKHAVEKANPDFNDIQFSFKRKALKLKILKKFGKPYNYDILLDLKRKIKPLKYDDKVRIYEKTVKNTDIDYWKQKIYHLMTKNINSGKINENK